MNTPRRRSAPATPSCRRRCGVAVAVGWDDHSVAAPLDTSTCTCSPIATWSATPTSVKGRRGAEGAAHISRAGEAAGSEAVCIWSAGSGKMVHARAVSTRSSNEASVQRRRAVDSLQGVGVEAAAAVRASVDGQEQVSSRLALGASGPRQAGWRWRAAHAHAQVTGGVRQASEGGVTNGHQWYAHGYTPETHGYTQTDAVTLRVHSGYSPGHVTPRMVTRPAAALVRRLTWRRPVWSGGRCRGWLRRRTAPPACAHAPATGVPGRRGVRGGVSRADECEKGAGACRR